MPYKFATPVLQIVSLLCHFQQYEAVAFVLVRFRTALAEAKSNLWQILFWASMGVSPLSIMSLEILSQLHGWTGTQHARICKKVQHISKL